MKQKDKFRYAEKCLYEYKRNLAALNVLKEDLHVIEIGTDVHAQNYQLSLNFTGTPSNPVQARLLKIETIKERIQQLERFTTPITSLINDLDIPENLNGSENQLLLEILKLLYFGKNTIDAVLEELRIAKRTFTRKRRKLIFMVIDYLAF